MRIQSLPCRLADAGCDLRLMSRTSTGGANHVAQLVKLVEAATRRLCMAALADPVARVLRCKPADMCFERMETGVLAGPQFMLPEPQASIEVLSVVGNNVRLSEHPCPWTGCARSSNRVSCGFPVTSNLPLAFAEHAVAVCCLLCSILRIVTCACTTFLCTQCRT